MTLRAFFHAVTHLSVVALVSVGSRVAAQTTLTVETTAQQSGSQCTLSDAIQAVNTGSPVGACSSGVGADTIHVPAGIYELATYAVDEDGELTALPYVTRPIRMVGDGPGVTVIRRAANAPAMRLFKFQATFEIQGMTLAGGSANHSRGGGAILAETFYALHLAATVRNVVFEDNAAPQGGALADTGFWYGPFVQFTLDQVVFRGNRATGGGAIHLSPGSVINATGSRFENNTAAAWGGAIYNQSGGQVTIADSQFRGNLSAQEGGAIHAASPVLTRVTFADNEAAGGGALYSYGGRPLITGSTFTGNRARRGGAVEVSAGSIEIDSSTFSGNSAEWDGGALYLDDRPGTSKLANSTFSGNQTVGRGGGVYVYGGGLDATNVTITGNVSAHGAGLALGWWGGSTVRIANSIVAGNHDPLGAALDVQADPNEQLISLGSNVIGTDTGTRNAFTQSGDQVGTAESPLGAGLMALADNGGPTQTHALAPFSAALDAGSTLPAGAAGACEPVDQRGMARPGPGSSACDVGAYEHGIYHWLQVTIQGGGSIAGVPGVAACTDTCAVELGVGTVVSLQAPADSGFAFVGWSGACADTGPVCVVTMTEPQSVTATFAVAGGETQTRLTSTPNPSAVGEDVSLVATIEPVPPAVGTPTGTVRFLDTTGPTLLGAVALDSVGRATLTISSLPQGRRAIQALYDGDGLFDVSVSVPLSHSVGAVANVAPSFAMPAFAEAVLEDAGAQVVPHFASVMMAGPAGEGGQSLVGFTLAPVITIGGLGFVSGPHLALDGTLTFEAAPDTNGYAIFRVTLQDDGGTDAGGRDTSDAQDLTITVTAVNDPPVITAVPAQTATDLGPVDLTIVASDPEEDTLTYHATGLPPGLSIDALTGRIAGTPNAVVGQQTFASTITVTDEHGDGTQIRLEWSITHEIPPPLVLTIAETIRVSDSAWVQPAAMLAITESVVVTDGIAPTPAAMLAITETVHVADGIASRSWNTGAGDGVAVQPRTGVDITFARVVERGDTVAEVTDVPPPPPGYEATVPPVLFEITTTAQVTGAIAVCLQHPPTAVPPRLMHFETGRWVDRTTSHLSGTVCGQVSSLSPFAAFVAEALPGRMHGQGSLGERGAYEFEFRVAEKRLGSEDGHLRVTIKRPIPRGSSARPDVFRSTAITAATFADDPSFRPGEPRRARADTVLMSGQGRWNGRTGYRFEAVATDHGEPGRHRDTFRVTVFDSAGSVVASTEGSLTTGNIQSLRLGAR